MSLMRCWNKKKKPKHHSKSKWVKGIYHDYFVVVDMLNINEYKILSKVCKYEKQKRG